MIKETLYRLPTHVRLQIENLRTQYKNPQILKSETRASMNWYVKGLRDAGLITERERSVLFVYMTV